MPDNTIVVFPFADDYSFGILAVRYPLAVVHSTVFNP